MTSGLVLSEGKFLSTPPSGKEWTKPLTANVGGDRMNHRIRIPPLPSVNGLLGGRISGQRLGQLPFLRMGNYP